MLLDSRANNYIENMKGLKPFLIFLLFSFLAVSGYGQSNTGLSDFGSDPGVEANEIVLFPTLVVNELNVVIKNSTLGTLSFELYNIIGNSQKFDVERVDENHYKIQMKDLPKGYYLLSVVDEGNNFKKARRFQIK